MKNKTNPKPLSVSISKGIRRAAPLGGPDVRLQGREQVCPSGVRIGYQCHFSAVLAYRSSDYHYGLMDRNGNMLTPPL